MSDIPSSSPVTMISPHYSGVVTIKGADAFSFLQNIITNDLTLLQQRDMIESCLLTPQGKFLHHFYVRRIVDGYAFACEGAERMEDLAKRLSFYKLRSDVTIACWSPPTDGWMTPEDAEYKTWDKDRIRAGRADGSRDAEVAGSTLAELNLDECAVSYTKGCYVGQELVARMHNRNLGKKHLVGVEFSIPPSPWGTEIDGLGIIRSSCENMALVLMNRDVEEALRTQSLILPNVKIF